MKVVKLDANTPWQEGEVSAEPLWQWIRRVYEVHEPPERENCVAFDRDTHEPVGAWEEGGKVPDDMYQRYLDEVPGAREELEAWQAKEDS